MIRLTWLIRLTTDMTDRIWILETSEQNKHGERVLANIVPLCSSVRCVPLHICVYQHICVYLSRLYLNQKNKRILAKLLFNKIKCMKIRRNSKNKYRFTYRRLLLLSRDPIMLGPLILADLANRSNKLYHARMPNRKSIVQLTIKAL